MLLISHELHCETKKVPAAKSDSSYRETSCCTTADFPNRSQLVQRRPRAAWEPGGVLQRIALCPEHLAPSTSRRLAGNYSRASRRITCRCLSVFNHYRRRSRMTGISPTACHPDREAIRASELKREAEKARENKDERGGRDRVYSPPREYARCRARTAPRILTIRALLWHVRNKAQTHFTPGAFDLGREAFSERSHHAGRLFQLFNGQLDLRRFHPRRSRNRNPLVLTILEK